MIAINGKNQPSNKSQLSEDMSPKPTINKTEVVLTSKRRQFSKHYKKRILLEAEQCQHGQLGALLRREGLYSSHLSTWRRELAMGKLDGSDREKKADKKRIEQLEKESPNRINIIFDNTGGVVMNESLKLIAMHGVVLLCGSTSQYTEDKMDGPSNYIWLGSMRARLQGFVIFDYIDRYPEARENMSKWINSGLLKIPEYCCEGDIDDFPETFRKLFEGENLGKMLLKLSNI